MADQTISVVITGAISIDGADPVPCVVQGEVAAPPPVPPPPGWQWSYSQEFGWVLVPPGGGDKPQPLP